MSNKSCQKSPSQNCKQFSEDTIYGTPVPQAASTANREGDNRYSLDLANIVVPTDVKKDQIMEDAVSKIGNLQQMLQTEFERIRRSSSRLSSTSSLGILKGNEIESTSAIFEHGEVYNWDTKNKNNEISRGNRSMGLSKDTLSTSQEDVPAELVSSKLGLDKSPFKNYDKSDLNMQRRASRKLSSLNLICKQNLSMQSDQFIDGEAAVKLLKNDEEEWLKNRAVLPVTCQDTSLSGIYSDYSCVSQSRPSMLSFLRKGSYPLGSSLSDVTKSGERPCFGREINSPGKKYRTHGMPVGSVDAPNYLDEIPVKQESRSKPVETSQSEPWSLSSLMEQYSEIHDSDVSKSSVSMSAKSMMSISQIANMLENMTCASPRDLFDNLMKQASVNNTDGKTANRYREKENITPNIQKSNRRKSSYTSIENSTLENKKLREIESELRLKKGYEMAFGEPPPVFPVFMGHDNPPTSVSSLSERRSTNRLSFRHTMKELLYGNKSLDNDKVYERLSELHNSMVSYFKNKSQQHQLSLSESLNSSGSEVNLNASGMSEVEAIPVCIAVPITMDFDITNDRATEQHCSITKDAFVDDKSDLKAAIIQLDSDIIILKPWEKRMISVVVSPLVPKEVIIQLTICRVDVATKSTELHKVTGKVLGEYPSVKILDERLDFGKLPEECVTQQVVEILNYGQAVVPINICVNQHSEEGSVFFLDHNRSEHAEIVLYPGEKCEQTIVCCAPSLSGNLKKKHTEVSASLNLYLRIPSSLIELPEVDKIPLTLCIIPCSLKFSNPLNHVIQIQPVSEHKILVTNTSPVVLNIAASVNFVEFSVEPNSLRINSDERACVCVRYQPLNRNQPSRKATLTLQVLPAGKKYEFCLMGETGSRVSEVNLAVTPESSRASSPLSPTSSTGSAVGSLQLQCSHKALVWANCALHSKNIKSCVFRNRSMHREKLLITVNDNHRCFKILKEKKKMDYQMHMSLQPMESTTISVIMLPSFVGPVKGLLSITRIGSESENKEKNLLPLFGYGGKSRLVLQRVLRNPDQQMWIYLDSDTLNCKFRIQNVGDSAAFVKISQGIEATGVSLSPPECIVEASSEVEVEVSLRATQDRLEHLLMQPSDTVVRVVRLIVTYGDEATLHRLRRLYLRHNLGQSDMSSLCHSSLSVIIDLFADRESDTEILKDPKSGLETLWQEGIQEWNIGVLVERTVLEAMRLDTSLEFTGLRTDLEETVYTPNSLTVTPKSLNLSQSCNNQVLLLVNSDTRDIGFRCNASQGLQVNPKFGTIAPKSPVEVRVHWDRAVKTSEPLEIKVFTTHGYKIVVPVKCA